MMNDKKIIIGLFGFGTVGQSLYDIIEHKYAGQIEIVRICIKDKTKQRSIEKDIFCDNAQDIFGDKRINCIIELIDDAQQAFVIAKKALQNKLPLISGNKNMIANNMKEIIALQKEYNTPFLYDASVCGSIPIIRNIEDYFNNELIVSVEGILNGSSNYILSKVYNDNMTYEDALFSAQELGFAESNPFFDVQGIDSLYKQIIIALHTFGLYINMKEVFTFGIDKIKKEDILFAKENSYKIKLVADLRKDNNKISLKVMPSFVSKDKCMYNVENEYNGVVIKGECYEEQFFLGKGAGGNPTASSVLSDIISLRNNYRYKYHKYETNGRYVFSNDSIIRVYLRCMEEELILFDFDKIEKEYNVNGYNYVVGTINLNVVNRIRDKISSKDFFIATID